MNELTEMLIAFLKKWKDEKENGEIYQIPTVELLIEELEALRE